jgi:hypothetical protein
MITDTPLAAGHSWEPAIMAYYKMHLMTIAKDLYKSKSDVFDESIWKLIRNSIVTKRSGLLLHPTLPFLCYSPDCSSWCYVANCYIFAEFKLLFTHLTRTFDEIASFYMTGGTNDSGTVLKLNDFCLAPVYAVNTVTNEQEWSKDDTGHFKWQLNKNHPYWWQCVAAMNIGDRDAIDFVAITGSERNGVFVQRLYRSDFVSEWKQGEMIAEWIWCNQVLQHLTSPLQSGKLRQPLATLVEFKKEIENPGAFSAALTWAKITTCSEQINKKPITIR